MGDKGLIGAAVGIGVTAIVLVLALWLGATIYTEIPLNEATIANESFNTGASGTWAQLAYTGIKGNSQTVVNNSTAATNVTDYKMNYTDGTIQGQNTTTLPQNTIDYIAYTYTYRPSSQSATFSSMGTGITLLAVGLIIAAAMVILTMVLKIAGKGGGKGGEW